MRPSQEDNLTENTISNRDNRRDIATLRRATSKRRKRNRSHTSNTQQTQRIGNMTFSRASLVRGIQRQEEVLKDKATDTHTHTHIRPYYKNGHMNKKNQGFSVQQSILTYDGVIQIGGQATVMPAPRRGVGKGNKRVPGSCNLAAMRHVNSANTTVVPPVVLTVTGTGAF